MVIFGHTKVLVLSRSDALRTAYWGLVTGSLLSQVLDLMTIINIAISEDHAPNNPINTNTLIRNFEWLRLGMTETITSEDLADILSGNAQFHKLKYSI